MASTGAPNWEQNTLFILLYRILNNTVGILGQSVVDVNYLAASRNQDSIDLGEGPHELLLREGVEEGDDLGTTHFEIFYIACRNVSRPVVIVLSQDANDGFRAGDSKKEQ